MISFDTMITLSWLRTSALHCSECSKRSRTSHMSYFKSLSRGLGYLWHGFGLRCLKLDPCDHPAVWSSIYFRVKSSGAGSHRLCSNIIIHISIRATLDSSPGAKRSRPSMTTNVKSTNVCRERPYGFFGRDGIDFDKNQGSTRDISTTHLLQRPFSVSVVSQYSMKHSQLGRRCYLLLLL